MLYRIQKGQVPKITHLPVAKVEQMKLLSHQRQLLITSSLLLILKTCKLNTHMSNAIKKVTVQMIRSGTILHVSYSTPLAPPFPMNSTSQHKA